MSKTCHNKKEVPVIFTSFGNKLDLKERTSRQGRLKGRITGMTKVTFAVLPLLVSDERNLHRTSLGHYVLLLSVTNTLLVIESRRVWNHTYVQWTYRTMVHLRLSRPCPTPDPQTQIFRGSTIVMRIRSAHVTECRH